MSLRYIASGSSAFSPILNAAVEVVARHADRQRPERLVDRLRVARHRSIDAGAVERVVAGDHFEQVRESRHVGSEGADLVQGRGEGDQAEARDAAVTRLEAG